MPDRDDAIAFLRTVMDDGSTSMANRIKAAEAIVRATGDTPSGASDVHSLDDGELLARARGMTEGGDPPREGPEAAGLSRDPSHEHGGTQKVPPDSQSAGGAAPNAGGRPGDLHVPRNVPRETPLTAKRGPGRPKKNVDGTQKGPDGTQNGPANSIPIAPDAKNGQPLEPWE